MCPLIGIELDDKSHQRPDRQARDEFVDRVFAAAGLPIVHILARRTYAVMDITAQLASYLNGAKTTGIPSAKSSAPIQASPEPDENPRCPKCGSPMLLRTAKTGPNAGNRFWGCSNYPACRSVLAYKKD
jgi:hypothetical protein